MGNRAHSPTASNYIHESIGFAFDCFYYRCAGFVHSAQYANWVGQYIGIRLMMHTSLFLVHCKYQNKYISLFNGDSDPPCVARRFVFSLQVLRARWPFFFCTLLMHVYEPYMQSNPCHWKPVILETTMHDLLAQCECILYVNGTDQICIETSLGFLT